MPTSTSTRAGFRRRFLAFWIDNLILALISFSAGITIMGARMGTFSFPFHFILAVGYYTLFWVKQNGQTLGKRLMGIRVVKEDGSPMDIGTSLIRYVGYIISGFVFCLGYLWIIWDSKKQGWHDKIAHTYVVETTEKPKTVLVVIILLVSTIIPIFIIVGLISAGVLLYNIARKNPQAGNAYQSAIEKVLPTLTPNELDELSQATFDGVNKLRKAKELAPLTFDNRLCAYAQRRLEQVVSLGRYDDGKGFYEDTIPGSKTWDTYFPTYHSANQAVYFPLLQTTDAEAIAKYWASGNEKSAANSKDNTGGCIRGNDKYMILVVGGN